MKRQEILIPVSNCENLRSASQSFQLSDSTHATYFSSSACVMFNESLGTRLCARDTQNTTSIRTIAPQLQEKRLQSTQFVPRTRCTKWKHYASLRPGPSRFNALTATKRGWRGRTVRQWRKATKGETKQKKKWSFKQQTIKKASQTVFKGASEKPQKWGSQQPCVPPIYRQVHRYIRGTDELIELIGNLDGFNDTIQLIPLSFAPLHHFLSP